MKTAAELGADDEEPGRPPTHIIYTPVWHPDGGPFRKWLPIGNVWRDDPSGFICEIHSEPINREETATGYLHCVPVGAPRPQSLTMTRDEFIEQQYLARQ